MPPINARANLNRCRFKFVQGPPALLDFRTCRRAPLCATRNSLGQYPDAGVKWCTLGFPTYCQFASYSTRESATYPAASTFATSPRCGVVAVRKQRTCASRPCVLAHACWSSSSRCAKCNQCNCSTRTGDEAQQPRNDKERPTARPADKPKKGVVPQTGSTTRNRSIWAVSA